MLSEISQSEKDKYHMISVICGIKEQTELTGKMRTDSEVESMVTGNVGWKGEGIEQKGKNS